MAVTLMQGKIVQQSASSEQILCELAVRPLRFAFILNRDVDSLTLRQVYQYNTSLWGGYYNLFVPTDGHFIRNDWWQLLTFHDPDVVFYVGEIDGKLVEEIYTRIQPMQIWVWGDSVLENLTGRSDKIQPVLIDTILEKLFHEKGKLSQEDSIIRCPIIGEGSFKPFLELICGMWLSESNYEKFTKDFLGAGELDICPQNLREYLNTLDEIEEKTLPIDFTRMSLSTSFSGLGLGGYSIILSKGLVDNLFIYHALCWSHINHAGQSTTVIIPIESLKNTDDYRILSEWFGKKVGGNTFTIISHDVDLADLVEFREKLRVFLPSRKMAFSEEEGWVINLERCNVHAAIPQVTHTSRKQLVNVQNKQHSFEILKPSFPELTAGKRYNSKRWICELEIPSNSENKRAFAPSMFLDLNLLLSKWPERQFLYSIGSSIRLGRGRICLSVGQDNDVARFQLPSDKKVIETACENAGYKVGKGHSIYYEGMIQLIGNLRAAAFLHDRYILKLFSHSSFIQGNALTVKEMCKHLKISKIDKGQFENWIQTLAGKQILLRGYNLQCPICGLTTWYELNGTQEFMLCEGCRSSFQLPIHGDFAFRLNRLFAARQNQGSITILLTLLLLEKTAKHGFIWQADTPLQKGSTKTEIDIIAMVDGHLVMAECKNRFLPRQSKNSPELHQQKIDELKLQLQKDIDVALQMNAQLFLFSSLQEDIPDEISKFLLEQDGQHPRLCVRLVKAEELVSGGFRGKKDGFEESLSIFDVTEGNLLPPAVQEADCYQMDKHWPRGAISTW